MKKQFRRNAQSIFYLVILSTAFFSCGGGHEGDGTRESGDSIESLPYVEVYNVTQENPNDNFISFNLRTIESSGQKNNIDPSDFKDYLKSYEINGTSFEFKYDNKIFLCKSTNNIFIKFNFIPANETSNDTIIVVNEFILKGKPAVDADCPPPPLESNQINVKQRNCSLFISLKNRAYQSQNLYFSISGTSGPWEKGKTKWKTPTETIGKPIMVYVSTNDEGTNPIAAAQTLSKDPVSDAGCDCSPQKKTTFESQFASKFNQVGSDWENRGNKRQFGSFIRKYQINANFKGKEYDWSSLENELATEKINNINAVFKAFNVVFDCNNGIVTFDVR